ncbi:hypothetical protein Tco_0085922 [Tanacetum coccineum]
MNVRARAKRERTNDERKKETRGDKKQEERGLRGRGNTEEERVNKVGRNEGKTQEEKTRKKGEGKDSTTNRKGGEERKTKPSTNGQVKAKRTDGGVERSRESRKRPRRKEIGKQEK